MDILSAIKIQEIYRFDLTSLKDISKFLGNWNDLSDEEKLELNELDKPIFEKNLSDYSKEELIKEINNLEFWEEYNDKFVYGEVSKEGANQLAKYLEKFSGKFYDIGSGNGKLLIHLSLISNFDKYTGIELVKQRHEYALKINKYIGQNIDFICGDVLDIDISDADFIFLDDLMFPKDLRLKIINKIPKDCHYLSTYINDNDEFIEKWNIGVTWLETYMGFNLYKKR